MHRQINLALAALSLTVAVPAFAAKKVDNPPAPSGPPSCSVVTFNVATLSCSGFFDGNLTAEDGPKLAQALNIVDDLDPLATSLIDKIEWSNGQDANIINFDTPLSGQTLIGIHFGGGNTGYNGTAFWLLDLSDNTDTISWASNVQMGVSNAGLYLTGGPRENPDPQGAVPEPSTWAMMLLGFGAIGVGMRRRRPAAQQVRFNLA